MSQVIELNAYRKAVAMAPAARIDRETAIRWVRKDAQLGLRNIEGKAWREEAAQRRADFVIEVML